jgi:tetratricopeptide (TPR) repeat protein
MRGAVAAGEHRYREAEQLYRQALVFWRSVPDDGRDVAITSMNLMQVLALEKHYQDAFDLDLSALEALDQLDSTAGVLRVRGLDFAATLSVKLGRPEDAMRYYQRALVISKQALGQDHPFSGQIMLRYSSVLKALQRDAEAKQVASEAREIVRRNSQNRGTIDVLALRPLR